MVSELMIAGGLFIVSLVLLVSSATYLVGSLANVTKKIGLSGFIVGSLVLAMGNSLPEFTTALISTLQASADLGLGTLIGSPITNLCLIIGIVALISPIKLSKKHKVERMAFLFMLIPPIMVLLTGSDNHISRLEGAIYLAIFAGYQYYLYSQGVTLGRSVKFKQLMLHYAMIPLAVFSLIISGFLLVDTGDFIAKALAIPPAIIGLVIISIGTSLPDLSAGIIAALKKEAEMGVGDVSGANIFDVLFGIGAIALFHPFDFTFSYFKIPLLVSLGATAITVAYVFLRNSIDRVLGGILLASYVIYVLLVIL